MSTFEGLLGPTLLTSDGPKETETTLQDAKVVGLYFSAHFCPPCRQFTPELAKWYKENLEAKGMKMVFVSLDETAEEFEQYFAEMPWLAVQYSSKDTREELEKRYSVGSIPALVLLRRSPGSSEIEIVSEAAEGRGRVSGDQLGVFFPWAKEDLDRQRAACDQLFDYCDKDKDGFLSFEELTTLARSTGAESLPKDLFENMCEELECDPAKGLNREALWATYSDPDYQAGDVGKDLQALGLSVAA
mmetsp:Transcript_54775/g.138356  ORF Transcript_54775/g.138356 Transcript_54775/m.138356 type:complete len:245 (-) Transcript_54775:308-1042(-)